MIRLSTFLVLAAVVASCRPAPQEPAVLTVESVDLGRYVGDWFEIARFPNTFQQDCAGDVTARYVSRGSDGIDVLNRCRGVDGEVIEARGVARVADPASGSKLQVRFAPAFLSWLPYVWGDYWILGVAGDYSWAVVGSPSRRYLWVLSRAPALDEMRYSAALATARANGFDVERLARTPQTPSSP